MFLTSTSGAPVSRDGYGAVADHAARQPPVAIMKRFFNGRDRVADSSCRRRRVASGGGMRPPAATGPASPGMSGSQDLRAAAVQCGLEVQCSAVLSDSAVQRSGSRTEP
jgi:hypothetical protein